MSARPATGQRLTVLCKLLADSGVHADSTGPALVVFFRGDWCDYCREQLVELAQQSDAFRQYGVQVIAVTTDDEDGRRRMLDRIENRIPIIPDVNGDLIRELDLIDPFEFRLTPVSLPAVFLVDSSGVVQYHYVGRSPDDRPRIELLLLAAERLSLGKC